MYFYYVITNLDRVLERSEEFKFDVIISKCDKATNKYQTNFIKGKNIKSKTFKNSL